MIEISKKRYAELLRKEYVLDTLEYAGLDNWTTYDYAMNEKFDNMPSVRDFCNMSDEKVINYWEERD